MQTTEKAGSAAVEPPLAIPQMADTAIGRSAVTTPNRTHVYPVFDPDVEPPADKPLYGDFISAGDLVLWLGREKNRKTNVLLQLAICAALGRDFLTLRFAGREPL